MTCEWMRVEERAYDLQRNAVSASALALERDIPSILSTRYHA